jgi:endonuclease/exonuclease/phosphatase family metal-dependent hydrolase
MELITWNVQWFCGLDGRIDVGRIVHAAREMADFDVLCLQEVAVNYPRLKGDASHDQPALLRALLPGYEICFGAAVDELADDGSGRRRFGNLIASRLPVLQVQHHALPYPADAGVRSMPRIAVCATLMAPGGPVRVMTTHLEFYSQTMRLAQVAELKRLQAQAAAQAAAPPLPDDSGGPFQAKRHTAECIVTGDFNFDPSSPEYAQMTAPNDPAPRFVDTWARLHGERPQPPTFHVHDKTYSPDPVACDFVFATPDLADRVRGVEIDSATQVSDHQPVWVSFAD